jgi:hypothetical protein
MLQIAAITARPPRMAMMGALNARAAALLGLAEAEGIPEANCVNPPCTCEVDSATWLVMPAVAVVIKVLGIGAESLAPMSEAAVEAAEDGLVVGATTAVVAGSG